MFLNSCFSVRKDHVIHPKRKVIVEDVAKQNPNTIQDTPINNTGIQEVTVIEEEKKKIERIGDFLVSNNMISADEAREQVNSIKNFFDGKMTYAEMRARAG